MVTNHGFLNNLIKKCDGQIYFFHAKIHCWQTIIYKINCCQIQVLEINRKSMKACNKEMVVSSLINILNCIK